MHLHRKRLILDDDERVARLPTNFIASKAKELADLSVPVYASRTTHFCTFLERHPVFGCVPIDSAIPAISIQLIQEYYIECQKAGEKASTVRGREITLKEFCRWLSLAESGPAIQRNIYSGIKFLTPPSVSGAPRFIPHPEFIRFLLELHWEDQRVVAHFIYDTGVRISEVPRFSRRDIPDPQDYPTDTMYFPLYVRGSKGFKNTIKPRTTIISRPMISRINKYHNSKFYFQATVGMGKEAPLFLNTQGRKLTKDAIERFFEDGDKRLAANKISAHRLRHGTGYSVLKSEHGKELLDNLIVLKSMLGHSRISTTEIYARVPAPALRRNALNTASGDILFRFEEAQQILDATYRPSHKHKGWRRSTN